MGVGYYLHAVQMINDDISINQPVDFNVVLPLLRFMSGKADFYASL